MAPLFSKSISLTIDGHEYACQVKSAIIEATPGDTVTYDALSPGCSYSQVGATTYVLHLVGVQDHDGTEAVAGEGAEGLAAELWARDGEAAAFVFQAHGDGTGAHDPSVIEPAKSGTCILLAPNYGGEFGAWAEFDVALPISGVPVTVTAASELAGAAA